jgi:uncharacterized membrane-anchored protein YhcB (DUF1043 family)
MLKKISAEVAALIGSITLVAISIYNTERNIQENKRLEQQKNVQNENILDQLKEQNKLLNKIQEESAELRDKLNLYEKYYKEASNNSLINESLKSPTEFKNEVNLSLSKLNTNLDNMDKSSLSKLNVNLDDISKSSLYSFENNTLLSFSTSFILASGVALSAIMGLIFNHYIKLYGDQYVNKVPKLVLPIMNNYLKFVHYSNNYYIILIIVSQLLILLTSIYLKFRGIV